MKHTAPSLCVAGCLLAGVPAAHAATITQVGVDSSTGGDWRTSGTVKPNDVDGDNIYGTDGYRIASLLGKITPATSSNPAMPPLRSPVALVASRAQGMRRTSRLSTT